MPRSGYTLPVFACASALAALHWLRHRQALQTVSVDLLEPAATVEILIEQTAGLHEGMALAITRSDPGDNLDLTRNTPIWAVVEWRGEGEGKAREQGSRGLGSRVQRSRVQRSREQGSREQGSREQGSREQGDKEEIKPNTQYPIPITQLSDEPIIIEGGEGIGKITDKGDKAAIYSYAQRLLRENLSRMLQPGEKIKVTIILPEGRDLAVRTSNAAFGVVEGLSLLGTTGISQPLSAPGQLEAFVEELQAKASRFDCLVFCVGENGLDLAAKLGVNPEQLVKTANWLGPMLVAAGICGAKEILLFGYHGKLIKLAGGIFHTHHHLADGRREILTAHCANLGLPTPMLQSIFNSATAEAALKYLRSQDETTGSDWVNQVYTAIAQEIDNRCQQYIGSHVENSGNLPTCGSVLFDRERKIIVKSKTASCLWAKLC